MYYSARKLRLQISFLPLLTGFRRRFMMNNTKRATIYFIDTEELQETCYEVP